MKDHYEVKIFIEKEEGIVEKIIKIPKGFDVSPDKETSNDSKNKLFYVKLDRSKQFLEIKEARNIHHLSKTLKLGFDTIKNYLNGSAEILNCGVKMPLISSRSKDVYLISEYRDWIEMKNYSYMSREVIDDIAFRMSYRDGFQGIIGKGR